RCLRLSGRYDDEAAVPARHEPAREGLSRVLQRADQEILEYVPVLERGLLDRRSPSPSADEVDEPVHLPEALGDPFGPRSGRPGIEQVDLRCVDFAFDARGELVERSLVTSAEREAGSALGEAPRHGRAEVSTGACDRDDRSGRHDRSLRSWTASRIACPRQSSLKYAYTSPSPSHP